MHCLVTGVAGFIGSHLAERLLRDGHEVRGVDSFTDYYPRHFKEYNLAGPRAWQSFTLLEGDVLTMDGHALLDGIDWVFHQAGQVGVRTSWGKEFASYVHCNILATQTLLEAAVQSRNLRRFVYASSSSIYGNNLILPLTESMTPHPVSPYGVTKLAAEHLCSLYHANFGVPTVSLRYFTVYGPRQRPDMAFHRFCKAMLDHQHIQIYGDGQQSRDFTYVSDVVEANILAATDEKAIGTVLNIGGGSYISLYQALHLLQEVSGLPLKVTFNDSCYGDVRHTYASVTQAGLLIGYRPVVSLSEGLTEEFQYILSFYNRNKAAIA